MQKTNVMRLLDQAGIPYSAATYDNGGIEDNIGLHAAQALGLPPETVFKTLVLSGAKKGPFVCCIPVSRDLDLKQAAKAAGEKSAALLPLSHLTHVTGYVRGGCSPVGMKRPYPTFVDQSALLLEAVTVNAGAIGSQVTLSPEDLVTFLGARWADLTGGGDS